MLKCWQHYPESRPAFAELQVELDTMLTNQQQEEYIEINAVDEPYCAMYPAQDDAEGEDAFAPVAPQVKATDFNFFQFADIVTLYYIDGNR